MVLSKKIDLFREHRAEYKTSQKPYLVEVGPARYASIDGTGGPGGAAFEEVMGALYGMAYTTKFLSKALGRDYVVCKLEAQWWMENGGLFDIEKPKDIRYRMMIRVPDFVGEDLLTKSRETLTSKGKGQGCERVTLRELEKTSCVQALHVGPYDQEGETLEKMIEFVKEQGLSLRPGHHEIYLSDPRRVPPERLRTLLRLFIQ